MWGRPTSRRAAYTVVARDRLPSHSRPQICRQAKPTDFPDIGQAVRPAGLLNVRTFHRQSDLGRTRALDRLTMDAPPHICGLEIQRALGSQHQEPFARGSLPDGPYEFAS